MGHLKARRPTVLHRRPDLARRPVPDPRARRCRTRKALASFWSCVHITIPTWVVGERHCNTSQNSALPTWISHRVTGRRPSIQVERHARARVAADERRGARPTVVRRFRNFRRGVAPDSWKLAKRHHFHAINSGIAQVLSRHLGGGMSWLGSRMAIVSRSHRTVEVGASSIIVRNCRSRRE